MINAPKPRWAVIRVTWWGTPDEHRMVMAQYVDEKDARHTVQMYRFHNRKDCYSYEFKAISELELSPNGAN